MEIVEKKISELIPYSGNPRINDQAVKPVAESIKQFGFKVPIIIDKDSVIVCGHTRLKAAKLLKLKTVPCILADDLTEEQIRAFRLADNKVSELATWDFTLLENELACLEDMDVFGFEESDFGEPPENGKDIEYTKKIEAPIYRITGEKPEIKQLYDESKTAELIEQIDKSGLSEEEKDFFKIAAQRHLIFDYHKIAEYYAHSEKETQEIMEEMALIIIDFDKAIEIGYVKLGEKIKAQYEADYAK